MENEVTLLNTLLYYAHQKQHSDTLLVRNLDIAFQELSDRSTGINIQRLCEQLYEDGFLYKQSLNPNTGNETPAYSISTRGILLFEKMPSEYEKQPYTYHLILVNQEVKEKKAKEELERNSIKANINVSKSVQDTNTNTVTFYGKQRTNNRIQIGLTIALLISSGIYTTFSIFSYNLSKSALPKETDLQELKNKLKKVQHQDSIFQNAVKDSLKMP